MRTIKVPICAGGDDIIKKAKEKYGKHTKVGFALWPNGKLRIILNGTCNPYDPEDFK